MRRYVFVLEPATAAPFATRVYYFVAMETGFETSYLLSPLSFDGVVYTDGKDFDVGTGAGALAFQSMPSVTIRGNARSVMAIFQQPPRSMVRGKRQSRRALELFPSWRTSAMQATSGRSAVFVGVGEWGCRRIRRSIRCTRGLRRSA